MNEILAVAVITVLAVIAPGVDFATVLRYSCLHGRTIGVLSATGVGMRAVMLRGQKVLNRAIGSVLAGLGISLAFAPSH